jgi:hypothetical protein
MKTTIHKTAEPVTLEGFQAVLKPSEYGYTLQCVITDEDMINTLEAERKELLEYQEKTKVKNPKRATLNATPWEELETGGYKLKFSWDSKRLPTIVDAMGTIIDDERVRVYSGTKVKIAFSQYGYTLPNGSTYGSKCQLHGCQIISLATGKAEQVTSDDVVALFGTSEGGFTIDSLEEPAVLDDTSTDDF